MGSGAQADMSQPISESLSGLGAGPDGAPEKAGDPSTVGPPQIMLFEEYKNKMLRKHGSISGPLGGPNGHQRKETLKRQDSTYDRRNSCIGGSSNSHSKANTKHKFSKRINKSVSQLSERVIRVMALNPSVWTLDGTCTYLIGKGTKRILIDTGEGGSPKYVKNLKRALLSGAATRIEAILLTHSHHDHIGGLKDVKNAFGARIPVYMLRTPGKELPEGITEMTDGQVFETIGATVRVVATPGHTDDHASFFVEEEGALFTGDSVLGEGATTFEDLDMYLGSLQKMLDIPHARTIYPGHGPPVRDVRGRLNAYISALAVRESAILNRLKRERDVKGRKGISTIRIVYKLYGDKDMLTQLAGAQVVIAHLKKLYDMGVVDFKPQRFIFPDKWTLKGDVDQGLFAKAQVQSGAPKAFGMSVADFNDAFGDAKGAGEAGSSPKYQPPASSASSSSSPGSTPVHSDASDGGSDAGSESTSTSTTSSMSTSTAST